MLTTARRTLAAALLVFSATTALAGVDESPFPELIASPFEARIGSMYQVSDEALRLDIGAAFDLMEFAGPFNNGRFSLGIDFMTWTRLRSEGNFKFPVETIDYWFGVNAKTKLGNGPFEARLRLAHISSHLADGLADSAGTISPTPFVYSREFAELIFARETGVFRPYIGVTAVWATQPGDPDPFIPQLGCDLRLPLSDSSSWEVRGGYDLRVIGIGGTYQAANAAQIGMMHRNENGTGYSLNVYGYSGRSMHGMFYTKGDEYIALGFQFLW